MYLSNTGSRIREARFTLPTAADVQEGQRTQGLNISADSVGLFCLSWDAAGLVATDCPPGSLTRQPTKAQRPLVDIGFTYCVFDGQLS